MNYTVLHIMYSNIFPDDGVLSCSVLTFIFKIESMEEYAPGIFLQSFCGIKKGLPLVDKLICPLFQPNFLHFHVGWRPAPLLTLHPAKSWIRNRCVPQTHQ